MNMSRSDFEKVGSVDSVVRRRHAVRYSLIIAAAIIVLALVVLFGYGIVRYFYFGNEHFLYRELVVEPVPGFTKQAVQDFLEQNCCNVGKTSLTTIDLRKLRTVFLEKNPSLENVEIRRIFPDALALTLTAREPLAYVCGMKPAGKGAEVAGVVDRSGIFFKTPKDKNAVPEGMPYIVNVENAKQLEAGKKIDSYLLKNAIELVVLIGGKAHVENAAYSVIEIDINSKYNRYECFLKPAPGNKVFSKDVVSVLFPTDINKILTALEKFDVILARSLKDGGTISLADMTLEHNVKTRP